MVGVTGRASLLVAGCLLGCEINPEFDPPSTDTATGTSTTGTTGTTTGATTTTAGGEPAIVVGELRATWATPNQIRWEWDPQGMPDSLLGYELVLGRSQADVESRTGSADVWTADRNPELGRFLLPNTGGEDPVVATITDGLEPDQVYYAQLQATDTAGNVSRSNVAAGRTTQAPIDEVVIFADEEPGGYRLPDTYALSSDRPYAGDTHLRYDSTCSDGAQCWENLRLQEMGLDLSSLSEGSYATTAFVEFALSVDGPATPWWCEVWLWYDGSDSSQLAYFGPWTARPTGSYYIVQVPLRDFRIGGDPVPYEDTQTFGLFGFNVGCPWADGAAVLVDEIRIRW